MDLNFVFASLWFAWIEKKLFHCNWQLLQQAATRNLVSYHGRPLPLDNEIVMSNKLKWLRWNLFIFLQDMIVDT